MIFFAIPLESGGFQAAVEKVYGDANRRTSSPYHYYFIRVSIDRRDIIDFLRACKTIERILGGVMNCLRIRQYKNMRRAR